MKISYSIICRFISQNKFQLILALAISLISSIAYFYITPKIYEATFHVRTAKIQIDGRWNAIKWARYTRRDLMSPQWYSENIVNECMGSDSNKARRNLVNAIRIDIMDDSGGALAISVKLIGENHTKNCAYLIANTIINHSNGTLKQRLADDGYVNKNSLSGRINQYQEAAITSNVRMSDHYVEPQLPKLTALMSLFVFTLVLGYGVLKRRYRSENN